MKIETLELRNQTADEGNWLYREQEDGFRYFTKRVLLGRDAEPWPECSDADRLAWQSAWDESHRTPESSPESEQPASEQPTDPEQEGGEG